MITITGLTAYYGMVTAAYFGLFMYRYKGGHILVTDSRASVNVMVLFVLAQPICRVIGGMNGLVTFAAMCMSSIVLFPSPQNDAREREEKRKKKQEAKEIKAKKKEKLKQKTN